MAWSKTYGRFPIWIPGKGERRAIWRRTRKSIRVGDLITWGTRSNAHEVLEISSRCAVTDSGIVYWCRPFYSGYYARDYGSGQIVRVAKGHNWRKQSRADRAAVQAARDAVRKRELERINANLAETARRAAITAARLRAADDTTTED